VSVLGARFLETAVNLYYEPALLDRDIATLRDGGYHIVRADASRWWRVADMHRDLSLMFGFPDYYGQNWSALNDCLLNVRTREYGFPSEASGLVIVITGFDAFVPCSISMPTISGPL
jgi:hypothetical protein